MGQVTIYLEAEIEVKMRKAVNLMNLSQSKWISTLIREKVSDEWPESVLKLTGAWSDLPQFEEIRSSHGSDSMRETL